MNAFQEMAGATAGVKAYPNFLQNKKGKVFWYAVLLVTIYFLIANVRGFISVGTFVGGLDEVIEKYVPDFELSDGTLYCERPVMYDEDGMLISIDTDYDIVFTGDESAWKYELIDYEQAMIADSEGIVVKSDGQIQMTKWPGDFSFDRDKLVGYVPALGVIMVVFYIFSYLGSIGSFFFAALILALIGLIIAATQQNKMTFGQIYLVAIYAKTAPLLAKGLFKLIGLSSVPVLGSLLSWVIFIGACLYLGFAMSEIKKQSEAPAIPQTEYPFNEQF